MTKKTDKNNSSDESRKVLTAIMGALAELNTTYDYRSKEKLPANIIKKALKSLISLSEYALELDLNFLSKTLQDLLDSLEAVEKKPNLWPKQDLILAIKKTIDLLSDFKTITEISLGKLPRKMKNPSTIESQSDISSTNNINEQTEKIELVAILHKIQANFTDFPEKKGKKSPRLEIVNDKPLYMSDETAKILESAFSSILFNSIEHGIETPEHRACIGKDPIGTIQININRNNQNIVVEFEDDGQGLDLKAIVLKARLDPDTKDDVVANEIFAAGISTSRTEQSKDGKGIGLTTAQALLAEIKGIIEVQFTSKKQPDGSRFVKFIVRVPSEYFSLLP